MTDINKPVKSSQKRKENKFYQKKEYPSSVVKNLCNPIELKLVS